MPLDLFPAWVPVEALFVGSIVTLAHIFLFNKSRTVALADQDEPVLVGIGATIVVAAWGVGPTVPVLDVAAFPLVGVGFVLLGYLSRYTKLFDADEDVV